MEEYCRRCGGPLDTVRLLDKPRGRCGRCGHVEYRDLAVAAATVTEVAGGVVLARRAIRPGFGQWVIPGGFVEAGETVAAAAVRETAEEVGLQVALEGLVGVYSYARARVAVVVYHARLASPGEPAPQDGESFEARGFARDQVPWDQLAFDSTRDALRDFFGRPSLS